VLFLAGKDARFVTGYRLTPDGGMIFDSARQDAPPTKMLFPDRRLMIAVSDFARSLALYDQGLAPHLMQLIFSGEMAEASAAGFRA
jgi:hypothetical protein